MKAVGKIPIAKGSELGLTFKENTSPLVVDSVEEGSSFWGIIREGYIVHGLTTGDQTKFEGLNAQEFDDKLIETSGDEDRRLLVEIAFMDNIRIDIGKDEDPFTFEESKDGEKVIVPKISDESLKKKLRYHMAVEKLVIKDFGVTITNPTITDLESCLKTNHAVVLCNPKKRLPSRKITHPISYCIDVPSGTDLGLVFEENDDGFLILKDVEDESFLGPKGKVVVGMIAKTLIVDDFQFYGLKKAQIEQTLMETAEVEGRQLILASFVKGEPTSSFRVPLQPLETGLEFEGTPPIISKVGDDSPLKGVLFKGQIVLTFLDGDGAEYMGMSDFELNQFLINSHETKGRALIVQNSDLPIEEEFDKKAEQAQPPQSLEEESEEKAEQESVFEEGSSYPHGIILRLSLPSTSFGVEFGETPAIIKSIKEDSPFFGMIQTGQTVLALDTGDGREYDNMADFDLQQLLNETVGVEGRKLKVASPGYDANADIDLLPIIDASDKNDIPYKVV